MKWVNCPLNFNLLLTSTIIVLIMYITEPPFTGVYNDFFESGIYVCRQCNTPLYNSSAKFHISKLETPTVLGRGGSKP